MLIKKSLPKCLIGFILFLMIGLPLIVLVFYGGYITGGEFSISKKTDDWADFGTLLSGLFTLSGALATLSTLIFLITQSRQDNINRCKQVIREKKVANLNKEKINFEKYKLHGEMFDDLINKVESRFNNEFSIINRTNLYRKIFTENTFNHCVTKIDLSGEEKPGNLIDITNWARRISDNLKGEYYFSHPEIFITDMFFIHRHIGMAYKREIKSSDMIYDHNILFNTYEIGSSINHIFYIVNELISFTQNHDSLKVILSNEPRLMISTYLYGTHNNNLRARDETHPIHLIEINNVTKIIMRINKIVNATDETRIYFTNTINFICKFFEVKQKIIKLETQIAYNEFLKDYIFHLSEDLRHLKDFSDSAMIVSKIKNEITGAEKELI
ncbi:TPA: hypothetical protein PXM28_002587 [Yersinia enterocolitica]|nr:hypothetical protein [Yersinia enterocolitica]